MGRRRSGTRPAAAELLTLKGHAGLVNSVSWSPDGKRLATGSSDGTAKVWDAAGGRELLTLKGHTVPGQFRVLVAGRDAAGDGECGWHGEGVGRGRRPRAPHPQGASEHGQFRVLVAGRDAAGDGEWGWHGEGLGRGRRPGAAHPQGPYGPGLVRVLVAGRDAAGDGERGRHGEGLGRGRRPGAPHPQGHTSRVRSVSWSPDGTRLATGSWDGTAKVWDAAGGRELLDPQGAYRRRSSSVSWSPDGTRLATGS